MDANPPSPELEQRLHAASLPRSWRGHRFRYHLAAGFCSSGDTVLDAACGTGYGAEILSPVEYVGVDNDLSVVEAEGRFIEADLQDWRPDFDFDVFVGFETIEHLADYGPYVLTAKRAQRWILVSAPVVPTTHLNEFHLHNFAPGELASLFIDADWRLYQSILQPAELSEIYVFERR